MNGVIHQLCSSIVVVALVAGVCIQYGQAQSQTCSQVLASSGEDNYSKAMLCQLYESSSLLAQLGTVVSEGLERLLANQGVTADEDETQAVEKRKHEYLRFGKRKHEYLRFGKRKHEYLRFGRK